MAVLVLEDRIVGVKDMFHEAHWKGNLNPILRWAIVELRALNTMIKEPFVNKVERIICWLHKLANIGG